MPTAKPCEGSIFVSFLAICPQSAHYRGVWRERGPRNDGPAAEFAKVCHFFVHALLPTGGFVHAFVGVRVGWLPRSDARASLQELWVTSLWTVEEVSVAAAVKSTSRALTMD